MSKKSPNRDEFSYWKNNKYKCRECGKNGSRNGQKLSYDFVKNQFEERGYKLISTEYFNRKSKLQFQCDRGHTGEMTFNSFYYSNQGCIECAGSKRHTIDKIREAFSKEGYMLLSAEYKNNKTRLEYECPKGHTGNVRYDCFVAGDRCGVCCQSKGELAIMNHLNELGLEFTQEKKFPDCKNINPLPFDFYVDNRFIIEFDGGQHFKAIKFFGGSRGFAKRQKNDRTKTQYCRDNSIALLRISYSEINEIPECIDSFIRELKTNTGLVHFTNRDLYGYLDE